MHAATKSKLYSAAMRLYSQTDREVTISRLASEANLARPTIYAHFSDPAEILATIAHDIAEEMHQRVAGASRDLEDPAQRLAFGISQFIRRTHTDPEWGRFLVANGLSEKTLKSVLTGAPAADITLGVETGRYNCRPDQIAPCATAVAGLTLTAMLSVLEGQATWRDAAANSIEFALCMLGLDRDAARAIAAQPQPDLPPG